MLANKYLAYAAQFAASTSEQRFTQLKAQATPQLAQEISSMQMREQFGMMPPGTTAKLTQAMLDSEQTKPADKDMLRMERVLNNFRQSSMKFQILGTYLNQSPNRSSRDRDVLDFMLWDKKAKELGIDYSVDDVKNVLLPREFLSMFTDDPKVRQMLGSEYRERYSDQLCFEAIAAEFRVRTAQTVLLGITDRSDHTLTAPPVFTPIYELFEYYRDKTSPTSYEALRVPVECFLSQITETPSQAELDKLFKEREAYEPDPSREEPGFREPRRIKVEWVSVTGDEPYYKKQAAEWVTRTELLAKSEVRALIAPMPGLSQVAWGATIAAPASLKEPLVQEKYKTNVKDAFAAKLRLSWDSFSTGFLRPHDLLDTSLVKPQNLVAAAGAAAGSVGIGNPFLQPADLLYSATLAAEQKARIKACMPIFAGAIPGPSLLPGMIGGEVAMRKNIPEALSLEAYKPELIKEIHDTKARELALNDLKQLQKSITELKETGKAARTTPPRT